MATIQEKLTESLKALKAYQDSHPDNLVICGASTLGVTHTKRLVDNGYLQMVIKGWYIPSSPGSEGDSTVWYVSYWSFVVSYLDNRFGEDWCLSPELSLYVYSGKSVIPKQLIVRSNKASNNILSLPFGTSILDIKASVPDNVEREQRYGIRLYPLPLSLLMASPDYYRRNSLEARTCLSMIRDVSSIIAAAIDGGHSTRAGRVAGALRSIGRGDMADSLISAMRQVGYELMEENPFNDNINVKLMETSPYASRIRLMWMKMRETVIAEKESSSVVASPKTLTDILSQMDATYIKDSYNSLSIEGYKISEGLLEKVRLGDWDPKNNEEDNDRKNALAARGYYQAYQLLRKSITDVLRGDSAAKMYVNGHRDWHFQLFEPCIRAGIIKASDLIGYRTHPVYIRNSMHIPLNPEAVLDAMSTLSEIMCNESDAFVRAVLGHFFFVYIHPFMDGNGRTARFTMNSQLVTGGYNWVVVPVKRRDEYMQALEKASVEEDISLFVKFIISLM
jgi:hypothetical protein